MKKILNNSLFAFILGAIIFGSIGVYAASKIYANNISYESDKSTKTNVADSLDELYSMVNIGDATKEDIREGKEALVNGKRVIGSLKSAKQTKVVHIYSSRKGYSEFPIYGYTKMYGKDEYADDGTLILYYNDGTSKSYNLQVSTEFKLYDVTNVEYVRWYSTSESHTYFQYYLVP